MADNDKNQKKTRIFAATTAGQLELIPAYSVVDRMIAEATLETALLEYIDEINRDAAGKAGHRKGVNLE